MYDGFNIVKDFLPIDENVRPGRKISPKGMVIHWTGNINIGSTAENTASFFLQRAENDWGYGSSQYILDEDKIMYVIPENEMAYHVGANKYYTDKFGTYPNAHLLGLEVCVNIDAHWPTTYDHAVRFSAAVCKKYKWNPYTQLVRHYDVTRKDCPLMMIDLVHNDNHVRWSVESQLQGLKSKLSEAEFRRRVNEGIHFIQEGMKIDGKIGNDLWSLFLDDVNRAMKGTYKRHDTKDVTIEEKVVYHMSKYFADLGGHWAENTIDGLHDRKLSNGQSIFSGSKDAQGKLVARPQDPITRAETATLIERAIKYVLEEVKK